MPGHGAPMPGHGAPMPGHEAPLPELRAPLPAEFYLRPTLEVAADLLGKIFCRVTAEGLLAARIVEVEAYHQEGDMSAHSRGGQTPRNEVMFLSGGHLYVYFTYGMHHCMNVVTESESCGAAVLIRSMEPLEGLDIMRHNRGARNRGRSASGRSASGASSRVSSTGHIDLTNGPAKCCQAFGIDREQNGVLLTGGEEIAILEAPSLAPGQIVRSGRIGIKKSRELPWRFFENGSKWVSKSRPSSS